MQQFIEPHKNNVVGLISQDHFGLEFFFLKERLMNECCDKTEKCFFFFALIWTGCLAEMVKGQTDKRAGFVKL